jgi:hypothetical protein
MTHRHQQLRAKHEFELLQKHAITDHEKSKKLIIISIGIIILSLCLLFIVWSYVFSIHPFLLK